MSALSAQPWLAVAVTRRTWGLASRGWPVSSEDHQGWRHRWTRSLRYQLGGVP
jgi:hypothetical protein